MAKKVVEKSKLWIGMFHDYRLTRTLTGEFYWCREGLKGPIGDLDLEWNKEAGFEQRIIQAVDDPRAVGQTAIDQCNLLEALKKAFEAFNGTTQLNCTDAAPALPETNGPQSGTVIEISLGDISESPYQVRAMSGNQEIEKYIGELAANIRENGLINPLTVRRVKEGYELVAGHCRYEACMLLGLLRAPCYVREMTDRQAEDLLVSENLQRKDLTAIEEARSVARMLENGRTHEEVAKATGKSVRWVYRRASITQLIPGWVDAAQRFALSAAFLEQIGRLNAALQTEVLSAMATDEDLFKRGGDVEILNQEIEVSLRKLSAAPWAGPLLQTAEYCGGCADRSDAVAELFEDMEGEPRCLNKACWERKAAAYVTSTKKELKADHKNVIEAKSKDAYLYKETGDAGHSVPVLVTEGPKQGKVLWAPNPEAAKAERGESAAGPSATDNERGAYVRAVRACVEGAAKPEWCDDTGAMVPVSDAALIAFACGCGVSMYALVSAVYSGNLQRSIAILNILEKAGTPAAERCALWQACKPNVLKALDLDTLTFSASAWQTMEALAVEVKDAFGIPDALVDGMKAEFMPKKGKKR